VVVERSGISGQFGKLQKFCALLSLIPDYSNLWGGLLEAVFKNQLQQGFCGLAVEIADGFALPAGMASLRGGCDIGEK
jgi:hypothetical protein